MPCVVVASVVLFFFFFSGSAVFLGVVRRAKFSQRCTSVMLNFPATKAVHNAARASISDVPMWFAQNQQPSDCEVECDACFLHMIT